MFQSQQYYIKNNGGCSAKACTSGYTLLYNAFITIADSPKSRLVN